MAWLVATAGGFGPAQELLRDEPHGLELEPGAGPRLAALALLALLVLWVWDWGRRRIG